MLPAQRNTSKEKYPAAEQAKLQVIIDSITDDMSFQEQMAKLLEAWDKLPDPKLQWDYSVSLLRFFCMTCIEAEEYAEGEKWLKLLFESPYSEIDADPFEYGGIILFQLQKYDQAAELLKTLEQVGRKGAIKQLPPDVRKFYQEYQAKR